MVSLLDNGSGFRKVAPNTRSSEKPRITGPDHVSGCMADAASWRAKGLAVVLFTAVAADLVGRSLSLPSVVPPVGTATRPCPGVAPLLPAALTVSPYVSARCVPTRACRWPTGAGDHRVCADCGHRRTPPRVRVVGFAPARRRLLSVVARVRSGRDHAPVRTLGVTTGERCVRGSVATRDTSCTYEPSPTCSGWMSPATQKLWSPVSSDARRSPMLGAASRGSCGPRGC